ncbi:MAG: FlgD immunoglobulin-like domain containing protein, partial [Limisphaerales bacterium]
MLSAVTNDAFALPACRHITDTQAEQVDASTISDLLGLGTAKETAPSRSARSFKQPGLQYLLVFKQPTAIGTVLGGVGEVRVLKAGAPFPPEPSRASDWLAVEVQPSQSAPRFAPFPPGTQTRALLVAVPAPRDTRQSPFLRLHAPRLANHTPAAVANAETEHTAKSQFSPPYTHDAGHVTRGYGEWVNSGKDEKGINSRAPITELEPAWFVLSWPDARRVDGVLLQDNFSAFELQAFTGPAGINAAAATEQEWKTIRQFKLTRDGARRWLTFEPVQTRALRLLITKTDEGSVARLAGFSVFADLGTQPAPAMVKPVSSEPPVQISYDLAQAGKVTLVVNRTDGTRVRNLIANTPQPAGKNTVSWDLKDEQGNYVSPGDYQWKAITHPPLELRYEMTAYPNLSSYFPERPAWLTSASGSGGWLADHTPPRAACAWGDRVFLGAPVAESGVSLIECDLEGRKHWGHPSFEAFTGSWMLATDGKTVFNMANADNFARTGMDKKTEAIWAVDIESKKVRTLAMLQPTAERKRGLQGFAAHDNQLFLAIHATDNWLNNAAGAVDVDLAN